MPRGIYTRCRVIEFDMLMSCNRKAFGTSWLHEPYYRNKYYVPLCETHLNWIERPKSEYELDYYEWLTK